jgi:hypothetical protein
MKAIKKQVPFTEIENHFVDQLDFLSKSNAAFDSGSDNEFKRIAIALRTFFHRTQSSTSLIDQMGFQGMTMMCFGPKVNRNNLLTEMPLVFVKSTFDGQKIETMIVPALDQGSFGLRVSSLDDWWSEIVLIDLKKKEFSRKEFVTFVANQDGGAHVDPTLDNKYFDLKHENSIGFAEISVNGEKPLMKVERAYLRHIGFEAELSLRSVWNRHLGNKACHCGSGRKLRYCHGKQA